MNWNRRSRFTSPRTKWDDALSRMDPLLFERLIGDYFEREGYRVERVGTGGSRRRYDGGIDLKLYRGAETIVVQCKRHTHSLVTHNPMHELIGVMHTAKATGAILVNSGEFSDYARKMAAEEPRLRLIDGAELRTLLGDLLPAKTEQERTWEPADPQASRQSKGRGTYAAKPKQPTGLDALVRIGLLLGLLFGLKFCVSAKLAAIGAHPKPKPPQAAMQQSPEPTMEAVPHPAPSPPSPPQPAKQQRPYQTPDEAIRVLEASTPEV